jgi:alpha-L-rhamnosidase
MYGRVTSGWAIADSTITINITVPPNTTAKIILPSVSGTINETGGSINLVKEIKDIVVTNDSVQLNAGSGSYQFSYVFKPAANKRY